MKRGVRFRLDKLTETETGARKPLRLATLATAAAAPSEIEQPANQRGPKWAQNSKYWRCVQRKKVFIKLVQVLKWSRVGLESKGVLSPFLERAPIFRRVGHFIKVFVSFITWNKFFLFTDVGRSLVFNYEEGSCKKYLRDEKKLEQFAIPPGCLKINVIRLGMYLF